MKIDSKFNLIVGVIMLSFGNYVIYELDFFNKIIWLILVVLNLWFGIGKEQKK